MQKYLVFVLGSKHNDGPGIGEALEFCPHGGIDALGQDFTGVFGELQYILRDFIPEEGSIDGLIQFADDALDDHIGVQDGQLLLQLEGNGNVGLLDILIALHEDLVCLLVFSVLLFG
jgi:hypothetical protein